LDALLRRARRREPEALDALVNAYAGRVFGLLYRLTGSPDAAEELTQETFLRLVRMIEEYEHSGRFESWLFRISANLARDHARRGRRRRLATGLETPGSNGQPPSADLADARLPTPADRLESREQERRLAGAVARLSDLDREILMLRHYSGLSFREIADILGVPMGTALARAHRALARLRSELGEGG
jgi:RNA polymerase sigma-70 factor (ECF subfamily)